MLLKPHHPCRQWGPHLGMHPGVELHKGLLKCGHSSHSIQSSFCHDTTGQRSGPCPCSVCLLPTPREMPLQPPSPSNTLCLCPAAHFYGHASLHTTFPHHEQCHDTEPYRAPSTRLHRPCANCLHLRPALHPHSYISWVWNSSGECSKYITAQLVEFSHALPQLVNSRHGSQGVSFCQVTWGRGDLSLTLL